MVRKPYTVENQRPRRTVRLFGVVLAPKGKGRTSRTDLAAEEVLEPQCLRLIASGRIAVVRGDPSPVLEALEALAPVELSEAVAEAPPATETTPEATEVAPEPAVVEVTSSEAPTTAPERSSWSEEELLAMTAAEQKDICRRFDIRTGGTEKERVARILEAIAASGGQ